MTELSTKTTLVFLHGWGLNHGIWQPLAAKLADEFEITCLDLPGFGLRSAETYSSYPLEDIATLIAQDIPEQAVVVGWSLGGLFATYIANRFPTKVAKLVTVASSPLFVEQTNWPGIKPMVLKSFHQQLSKDGQKTIEGFLKIQAMGSPHLRHDIKLIHDLVMKLPQPSQNTLDLSLSLLETVDLRAELDRISQPFLRLYGEMDSLVPKSAVVQIDSLAPNSKSFIFSKASHAPFISHEAEFIEQLKHWLSES